MEGLLSRPKTYEASYFTELAIKIYMKEYKVDRMTALKDLYNVLDANRKGDLN